MRLDRKNREKPFRVWPNMRGKMQRLESGAMAAEGATIVGEVRLKRDANIWFGCVLRGDDEAITVGEATNIQDGTIIHVDLGYPTVIGRGVTIGHGALVHGCTVGDHALIAMGAIVLTGATIGEESIIAAGALVPEGAQIPPRSLVMGLPGTVRRELRADEIEEIHWKSRHYVERARAFL